MSSRCKTRNQWLFAIITTAGITHSLTAQAQMVLCTTQDGISFSTTTPDRFDLAVTKCHAAETSAGAPQIAESQYADQMRLYDAQAADIIVPTQPLRRRFAAPAALVQGDKEIAFPASPNQSSRYQALPFHQIMSTVGQEQKIDPYFLQAIAKAESGHNRLAVSPVGARGLMQLMPATARRYAQFDDARVLHDPLTNVTISANYLKFLQSRYGNNLPLILAAYNAGEGAVAKYGNSIPPYKETRNYVVKVLRYYNAYRTDRPK